MQNDYIRGLDVWLKDLVDFTIQLWEKNHIFSSMVKNQNIIGM